MTTFRACYACTMNCARTTPCCRPPTRMRGDLASGGRPFALIEHVVTLPPYRGQGLDRATMQYALDFAWSLHCCKVMLLSGVQRPEAHRLYESLGFRGDVERGFVVKPTDT